MKIKQIVEADFRIAGIEEETQVWLLKIPVIKAKTPDGNKVDIDVLDKTMRVLCKKYNINMQWITLTILPKGEEEELPWYSVSFKELPDHNLIKTIFGLSIYEIYCKSVLFLYAYTRRSE